MVKNNKLNLLAELFSYFTMMKNSQLEQSKFSYKMIKKNVFFYLALLVVTCLFSISAYSQYYYKDIWNNQQLVKEFNILKNDNLTTIKIKSFEDDNQPSEGFFCEKKINKNYTQSQMISKSNVTGQSLLVSDYNADGKPVKTTDDTPTTTSITEYEYDQNGQLKMIKTVTKGDDDSEKITETHEYSYDEKGRPLKMLRKKGNAVISTIHFVSDANGNIIEENVEGKSATDKKYYYYYDDKNRLTDVVHYNERAERLLPNYMYEYNALNQPKQMISTEEGGSNYFIWKYTYNDKNLRETEKCFSKERRLLGTIEYDYK
jgi:YD repeat-containing protein